MKIDAHHHFWRYTREDYGWIDDAMAVIRRDFLPGDLRAEIHSAGIDGVVSVQARQTLEETRWLLSLAADTDFIKGVVGWVPLIDDDVRTVLEEYCGEPKFRGVRHVLQGEPDDRYMLREDFDRGVRALTELGLVYDVLILERHLPQTIELVDRHPGQVFVLDHLAKPRVKDGVMTPWRENLVELAKRENVYCKVSGLVTEADAAGWTEEQLRPYFDVALAAFGPARLLFGSDWPVCLAACEYPRWAGIAERFAAALSPHEQARVFGETATEVYRLT